MDLKQKIIDSLLEKGKANWKKPENEFNIILPARNLIMDIKNYPHAFLIGNIVDVQIDTNRAWMIPYEISRVIGSFKFDLLLKLKQEEIQVIFETKKLHRFNQKMAKYVYLAIQKVHQQYDDYAANIWNDTPSSAILIQRLLEFKGMGSKSAMQTATTLLKHFKVLLKDLCALDISPDRHFETAFKRLGLVSPSANMKELVVKAREYSPEFPALLDQPVWEIGRTWCRPQDPYCFKCYMNSLCPKIRIT